jgi:hypothetical protein
MKQLLMASLCLLASLQIKAQHEVGLGLGTAHLLGDFGGGVGNGTLFIKDVDLRSTRPAASLFYRYHFAKVLALRAQALYGNLYSNDLYSGSQDRYNRALNASTPILDVSAQMEVHFVPLKLCCGKARFSPYVAAGIGFARVNPILGGSSEEGIAQSEEPYIEDGAGWKINVPIAFGVKYKTKKQLIVGLETSYRMNFSDNLDNYVRQENDHFFFVQAQVSYVFCKGNSGGKVSRDVSCPAF